MPERSHSTMKAPSLASAFLSSALVACGPSVEIDEPAEDMERIDGNLFVEIAADAEVPDEFNPLDVRIRCGAFFDIEFCVVSSGGPVTLIPCDASDFDIPLGWDGNDEDGVWLFGAEEPVPPDGYVCEVGVEPISNTPMFQEYEFVFPGEEIPITLFQAEVQEGRDTLVELVLGNKKD